MPWLVNIYFFVRKTIPATHSRLARVFRFPDTGLSTLQMKSNTQAKLYRNRFSKGFQLCIAFETAQDGLFCLRARQGIALLLEVKIGLRMPGNLVFGLKPVSSRKTCQLKSGRGTMTIFPLSLV